MTSHPVLIMGAFLVGALLGTVLIVAVSWTFQAWYENNRERILARLDTWNENRDRTS